MEEIDYEKGIVSPLNEVAVVFVETGFIGEGQLLEVSKLLHFNSRNILSCVCFPFSRLNGVRKRIE